MDDLQKEIAELKEFIADLKADRAATKEKEKREAWTKYVSLTLVFLAVIAAVAAQWGGGFGSGAQMNQAKASDAWSEYQANSIKQHLDEVSYAELTRNGPPTDPELAREVKRLADGLVKYSNNKTNLMARAKELEAKREESSKRGGLMGRSLALFSVAIALGSICTMTKKKPLWFVSMVLGAAAVVVMLMGKYGSLQ